MSTSVFCRESVAACLLLLALVSPAPGQDYRVEKVENPGSIKGRLFFAAEYPEATPLVVPAVYQMQCGKTKPNEEFIVSPKTKGLKNAVLYLEAVKAGKPFPKGTPVLEQRECRYEPHLQAVPVGATLEITNRDATLHNVHSYLDPDGKRKTLFNLAQPFKGKKDSKQLTAAGVVKVECDVHRWMAAYIVVRDNPYYSVTNQDGEFEIADIPPGEYQLVLWHEGLGMAKKTVVVAAGKATVVDFPLGQSEDETASDKDKAKGGD